MTNEEWLKSLNTFDMAHTICVDKDGNMRSPCGICIYQDDCTDSCTYGVYEWLKQEHKDEN